MTKEKKVSKTFLLLILGLGLFSGCTPDEIWTLHIVEGEVSVPLRVELVIPKTRMKARTNHADLYFTKTLKMKPPREVHIAIKRDHSIKISDEFNPDFEASEKTEYFEIDTSKSLWQVSTLPKIFDLNDSVVLQNNLTDNLFLRFNFQEYEKICGPEAEADIPCLPYYLEDKSYRTQKLKEISERLTGDLKKSLLKELNVWLKLDHDQKIVFTPKDLSLRINCKILTDDWQIFREFVRDRNIVRIESSEAIQCGPVTVRVKLPRINEKDASATFGKRLKTN